MITQGCDFVIANLESPMTSITKTKKCKGVYLRSEPTNVKILQELGVTHVTLANNHVYDYGIKGARETINHLAAAGIEYVGISGKTSLLEKNGERAFLGGFCCYSANGLRYGDGRVRMDLNEIGGKVYFGEYTFFHAGGFSVFRPAE